MVCTVCVYIYDAGSAEFLWHGSVVPEPILTASSPPMPSGAATSGRVLLAKPAHCMTIGDTIGGVPCNGWNIQEMLGCTLCDATNPSHWACCYLQATDKHGEKLRRPLLKISIFKLSKYKSDRRAPTLVSANHHSLPGHAAPSHLVTVLPMLVPSTASSQANLSLRLYSCISLFVPYCHYKPIVAIMQ